MGGITGFIDSRRSQSGEDLERQVRLMAGRLLHRGPDDGGSFVDEKQGLALGFRRLAIQDLTADGAQPMASHNGRYVITFNGEIYNFQELTARLEREGRAPNWRGHSDTEVMLACISAYGVEQALDLFDGMFALALYDRKENTLTLARDRLGEKPLYYGWMGPCFLFASELKALAANDAWAPELDRDAAAAFIRYSYVPAPRSIIRGIGKLLPGHMITLGLDGLSPGSLPSPKAFWDATAIVQNQSPFDGGPEQATDELEKILERSIARRMVADVPLGAFLSGGIDSSLVVALMQKQSARPINTYTIGFNDKRFDEAPHAKAVAQHLGTDHTELYVDTNASLGLVEQLPEFYDEPFADVSALPTLLLSRMTRDNVTTALAGDGGDELFCGYPRYHGTARKRRKKRGVPLPPQILDNLPFGFLNAIPGHKKPSRLGDKLAKKVADSCASSLEALYENGMTRWRVVDRPCPVSRVGYFGDPSAWPALDDPLARLMFADARTYLPDQLLVKVDRASMAVSLEVRAPMLAREVVEFAWALPSQIKHRDGLSKWPLRQVLYKHVPREIIDRPKQGFEPPLADWLCGPMRDWAQTLLSSDSIQQGGLLDPEPVRAVWEEHLKGQRNWHFELWNVLMLQSWRRHWNV
ncbi:asparagine synthase (glutamine-hydrolyzing) [Aestuariispira ectoiniformans]|uniref:asparagine synthase (glutamine-hydrolyzing) n=1 Tax=Aestuariispira ectoiniformans TaxID=2775080 RepID=UPI00223B7EAD|nr:asparagine synthase (glutamine-hydrolyzing) [Aestuariispira ectoiniformans]